MIPVTELLASIVGAVMAYLTYVDFRRRRISWPGLLFWEAVWVGLVGVTLAPGVVEPLRRALELRRLLDLVVIVGVVLLSVLMYRSYRKLEAVSRRIDDVVRASALADFKRDRPATEDAEWRTTGVGDRTRH